MSQDDRIVALEAENRQLREQLEMALARVLIREHRALKLRCPARGQVSAC